VPLQVYNTLTRRKETFEPIDPGHVRLYVCGPTVYDFAHLGNARPVVAFDVLYRLLKRLYPRVTYVRNITDVDDKIIDASKASGEPIDSITSRTTRAYQQDMAALGALPPDVEPRATEHIAEMIRLIEMLIQRGHAYAAEGHVLFSVPSMAEYGRLSRHNREELIAGARIDVAPYKKDPADFVLWKPSTPDIPGWPSPWGRGRPGWHIECSAMSWKHLGETFDLHGGGLDLIFPHHENEIAQSRSAHGTPVMARYWMHNGFLSVNSDKMSKSLGNFFTVRELLAEAPGEALRYFLLSGHYRAPLDFTRQGLAEAKAALDRLYTPLWTPDPFLPAGAAPPAEADIPADVVDALLDDLNTPLALSRLHALASDINRSRDPVEHVRLKGRLRKGGGLLGLLQQNADAWFRAPSPGGTKLGEAEIEQKIAARNAARKARNFAEADRIRQELFQEGIVLEDRPSGNTEWRRA